MTSALQTNFTLLDWSIVLAMLGGTTWFAHVLAGKQSGMRDFWLGGRKLPWYAVSASIVATQLSATTFITLPLLVYKTDFRFIQLALFGQLIARLVVGFLILPRYYKAEIYSPYEYMASRLGPGVRTTTTALFCLMAVLTRAARVYLTAVLVELLLKDPLQKFEHWTSVGGFTGFSPIVSAIALVCFVSMCWTLMGGIVTVVWTDLILFVIFFLGAVASLGAVVWHLPGGAAELVKVGAEAGKFRLFDLDPSPTKLYTIWTAVIAASLEGIGGLGTDQTITQRLLCCKNAVHARWALISSWLGISVPITCMFLGAALFAYYRENPMTGEALKMFNERNDRLFPIFILTVLPAGLMGFIVAGVLAAAIASLESVQAALAQATLSAFVLPRRKRRFERMGIIVDPAAEDRRVIRMSRWLIAFWTLVLGLAAVGVERLAVNATDIFPTLIELLNSLTGYVGGALLAGFVLAVLPRRGGGREGLGSGYVFAGPLSVVAVFALQWHDAWAQWASGAAGGVAVALWLGLAGRERVLSWRTGAMLVGAALPWALSRWGHFGQLPTGKYALLGWPWFLPAGTVVATVFSLLLARRAPSEARGFEVVMSEQDITVPTGASR